MVHDVLRGTPRWLASREALLRTDAYWPAAHPESGPTAPLSVVEGRSGEQQRWWTRLWSFFIEPRNVVVVGAVVLYVLWFATQSLKIFNEYASPPFDLAIFDQGLWLITHFKAPFVTVMGRNLFGDHTSFILLLFAPFYRIFPEPQGLLVLQTLLLASGAWPIYLIARRYAGSGPATMLALAYLLNPMLQQGNLDQFHPEAFGVPLVSIAVYAVLESRTGLFVVSALLILMVKEDAALLVVPLGLWFALRRDRRVGLGVVLGAVAWAMAANWLIIPAFLGAASMYAGYVPFGGVGGLLGTLVHRPGQLVAYLVSQGRPFYLWQVASTVGLSFLVAPEVALLSVLVVAENEISSLGYMHQIVYQFSMMLAPLVVMAAAYAVIRQRSRRRQILLATLSLCAALWSCAVWGLAPFSATTIYTAPAQTVQSYATIEAALPADAVVSAIWPMVAHIDHSTHVYLWPTPFDAQYYGQPSQSGTRLPVADDVRYLILPIPLGPDNSPQVFAQIASQFRLVRAAAGLGLYERIGRLAGDARRLR